MAQNGSPYAPSSANYPAKILTLTSGLLGTLMHLRSLKLFSEDLFHQGSRPLSATDQNPSVLLVHTYRGPLCLLQGKVLAT